MNGAPVRLAVEQSVLREFEFAPGNPWEASYVVRVKQDEQPAVEGLLLTSREPLVIDLRAMAEGRWGQVRMAREFIRHGILHILSGYDHLLFIAALALAVATLWDLVKVVSAFTLAHSLTLTLSVLNVVRLPEQIVEPMIAASIVLVALENVIGPQRGRGAGRLLVAFFFGLFHGLGFAGGLLSAMEGMAGLADRAGDRRVQPGRGGRPPDGRPADVLRTCLCSPARGAAGGGGTGARGALRLGGDPGRRHVLPDRGVALDLSIGGGAGQSRRQGERS